MEVWTK